MLTEDGGEAHLVCQRTGNAVNLTSNEAFCHPGFDQQLGSGVHGIAYVAGTVNGFDFLCFFGRAHLYNCLD